MMGDSGGRVAFLIRSLGVGGAERQLVALASGLAAKFEARVATFYPGGALYEQLRERGQVGVSSTGKRGRWDVAGFSYRLWRLLRAWRPSILHCYLPDANIIGLMAGRAARVPRVVWSIRAAEVDFRHYDRVTRLAFRAGAALSRFPDAIVVNSAAGTAHHVKQGYHPGRMVSIPNGFDTEQFRPDRDAGTKLRAEWGVGAEDVVIGVVARLDPIKDHATVLRAGALLARSRARVWYACVGGGAGDYTAELQRMAAGLGIGDRVIWAGERTDMRLVYGALDIACSSSAGEGFPNVVGEAMACGVPCVVTDVGDSAAVVGDTGIVVPPGSAENTASAWEALLALGPEGRRGLGEKARKRILENYPLHAMIQRTASLYETLLSDTGLGPQG